MSQDESTQSIESSDAHGSAFWMFLKKYYVILTYGILITLVVVSLITGWTIGGYIGIAALLVFSIRYFLSRESVDLDNSQAANVYKHAI